MPHVDGQMLRMLQHRCWCFWTDVEDSSRQILILLDRCWCFRTDVEDSFGQMYLQDRCWCFRTDVEDSFGQMYLQDRCWCYMTNVDTSGQMYLHDRCWTCSIFRKDIDGQFWTDADASGQMVYSHDRCCSFSRDLDAPGKIYLHDRCWRCLGQILTDGLMLIPQGRCWGFVRTASAQILMPEDVAAGIMFEHLEPGLNPPHSPLNHHACHRWRRVLSPCRG